MLRCVMASFLTFLSLTVCAKDTDIKSPTMKTTVSQPTINGYTLPPEPDPKVNNSTLLGIDSNNNGVRDDVERKIIDRYKAEPIKIELQMIYAKVFQEILENPIGNVEVLQKKISKNISCEMYLLDKNIDLEEDNIDFIENSTFNTKQRVKAYLQYNQALSGGVYGSSTADENAQACDFDVEQMLKDKKCV